ncbi:WecB/TagA/CpsF family glycosyltransferase [Beijerinckia indica]|uniref:Glycosyl transferase, WecB/TagA/CpsF family n=1 Tax=Beijerinckia indica subsp. indica (strain ATCC 9039 / DSM 1715 / NCIMB 8712) TaxID=395963 RepID=B2IJB0_BEII9|nr:WecB/TagA/CpsF family glycosyltransferase [Beijerinckia indica]ACB96228.1 glycosyl transferase, WecB/TagA/CpsF family [Beijerinckia indica subsp. indica ATCC 9039]
MTCWGDAFKVNDIAVNGLSEKMVVRRIFDLLLSDESFTVFTINLDHIVKLKRESKFAKAYNAAEIVTADGFPIVLIGRLLNKKVKRTTGADLIEPVCAEAARKGIGIFLCGSTHHSLQFASQYLCTKFPNLDVRGYVAPPYGFDPEGRDADELIKIIDHSGARIAFLAFGAPKQEVFSHRAAQHVSGMALLSIGAGLDFLSGHQLRAPDLIRKLNLEWAWRLASNPRRFARRYADCLSILPGLIISTLIIPLFYTNINRILRSISADDNS